MRRYCIAIFCALLCCALASMSLPAHAEDPALTQSNLQRAQEVFEQLVETTPNDPDIYRYLGDIYSSYNDIDKARDFYLKYAEMRPQDYYPYYQLGSLYWNNEKKKQAKEYYREALARMPPAPPSKDEPLTKEDLLLADLATAHMNALLGDKKLSDEQFANLLLKHPDNDEVATPYVNTLIDQKRTEEALAFAKTYLEYHPRSYTMRGTMARAYILDSDYDKAESIIDELLKDRPSNMDAKTQYAYLKQAKREWFSSLPVFEELVSTYPDNPDIKTARDDAWRETRPTLRWGGSFIRNGQDNHYGPYVDYYHPINNQWAFNANWSMLRHTGVVPGFDPDYVAYSNIVSLMALYKPYWTVTVGGGMENQLVDGSYSPAPHILAIWDDPVVGQFRLDYIYNGLLFDPTSGLYFNGKKDMLLLQYGRTFYDFFIFSAYYGSNWYRVDSSKVGIGLGDEFGREDIAGGAVQFIVHKRPDVIVGYAFDFSKLHVVNNYLPFIPLITNKQQHSGTFMLGYDWNRWVRTEVGGFFGYDPKRNLGIGDLYGFDIANRVRISKRFEIAGWYNYSSESPSQATTGHYQTGGLDFLYRF